MRILIVSPKNKTVFNFRGDLIRDMISKGHEVYVTGPNMDYYEDIYALGVKEFIEVPFVKDSTSFMNDFSYLRSMKKVMRRVKPELVFSYTIKPVIYGSLAAKACGVKHIFPMITGLGRVYASKTMKAKLVRRIVKLLYYVAFKGCEKVIFQNQDDASEFAAGGYLPKEKCRIVNGSGVNMQRFERSPIPEQPTFLMVSRIIKEKGVIEYAEAARIVKKKMPEARFVLLGGFDKSIGALKEEDISEYISDGSIELHEEVKDPVAFYGKASVFVLPSYYREGVPRTILEGMSCGRPVITTDWTGCREPIEDGINGYLVPVMDSEELAKRMYELANDREKVLEMSDAAIRICKEKYSVDIVNQQMRDIMGY